MSFEVLPVGRTETYLVEFPVPDRVVPVLDGVVDLLCEGAEKIVLDQLDVETLVALEGVKPLPPDAALVQHQSFFAVLLSFPWVAVEVYKESRDGHGVRGWAIARTWP